MKTIISDRDSACRSCAELVRTLLAQKPAAIIAFSIGEHYEGFFRTLRKLYLNGEIDFSFARILGVNEFATDNIMERRLERELLSAVNIKRENVFLPTAENFAEYDALIASLGGIDLLILDIGENARIGFNDIGTDFSSLTHLRKLTPSVLKNMSWLAEEAKPLPQEGITLGIKSIAQAKSIILLALGESKADSVYKMLYGRNDPATPAAFLQIPMNVSVFLDADAASKL